ncbi:hypothetical protein PUNSTDRAFT_68808 [Punctularia strigosozonata HHB-11173 SS5]|uniref:uncharacterized protein n=1 Tax=Punctularia strigosozonata (strain HHB-11173) TaxID=741275 RepID=UPI00044168F3|nr:uncharacterized protein PUNSTDRAFT_68808 [Punctularia strigosozonata HHB-11173 SS5]EIN08638.1 hypothetical protein PUNSTDRAFT_68808 [Punctularia strigosozonata HHB-11173 SS5]
MSSMKAYLAAKYMSGPKADAILARTGDPTQKKKKKKKHADPSSSATSTTPAFIKDDDIPGWAAPEGEDGDDEELKEAVVASDRGFKKRRVEGGGEGSGGGWATIRAPTPPPAEDEKPQVVEEGEDQPFVGGLLTKSQIKKHLPSAQVAKKTSKQPDEEAATAQETVYRDASGRRIDTAAEKAEAARKKREREEREARKMEWGKGLVQRDEEKKRREELEKARTRDVARYADDREMNEEMRAQERWNDPAAQFLTKKKSKGPRRPEYSGPPPPPNRFGIKPGYRWDGVDRGNGFEKRLFQKLNERKRAGREAYEWSVDDM